MAVICKECGVFSGIYNRCVDHRDISRYNAICNICCGGFFRYDDSKHNFLCEFCKNYIRVWIRLLIYDDDGSIYYNRIKHDSHNFPGFVTYDGKNTYYSKPDLNLMNIDLKFIDDNWDINEVIKTLKENGIDMTEQIQIRIKKPKSAKSNISFIEK